MKVGMQRELDPRSLIRQLLAGRICYWSNTLTSLWRATWISVKFIELLYVCDTGIPVSLLLNVTDLELPGRISRVEFIDLHGDVLTEIPTQFYDTRPALYNVSDIVTPAQFFYIKVIVSVWFATTLLGRYSLVQNKHDPYSILNRRTGF